MFSPSTSAGLATAARGRPWLRLIPLSVAVLSMVVGLYGGLVRLGVALPADAQSAAEFHGALMVSGFLGTVISLERAVAFGRLWPYAAPLLSGIGAVALIADLPRGGALAFALAGGVMLLASVSIAVRQLALFTIVLSVGAACWIAGTLQWLLGAFTPAVTGWWLSFLILTIAAERLELGRMRDLSPASRVAFAGASLLLLLGSARGELAQSWAPLTAAGLFGLSAWLLWYDVARRTVRLPGLPRFSAVAILLGHCWLGVAAVFLAMAPAGATAFSYDACVHAITIGFALSMILGHAPIILPAVTGFRLRYSGIAYAPLVLLHISVVLRIAGDILEQGDVRSAGGLATVLALAAYAITLVFASVMKKSRG